MRWEIAHDDKFDRIVQRGQAVASAALADSVHVEVAGLEPDRWYFYRFMAGDAQSTVGRTRTFPAPDAAASRLRIAYASCQRWEHGYFSAYRHMRQENPDVVLFLGDYIYEYPNAKNAVRVPTGGWVRSLADYRARYALHKSDPDLQAMHAVCPWLLTWDDHEVQNDYAGLKEGQSGTPVADFAALRAAAYQAYYEHMPLRAAVLTRAFAGLASGAEMRIHSSVPFGTLASFHLVDDRQYRDPQACTPRRQSRARAWSIPRAAPSGRIPSARCSVRRRKPGSTTRSRAEARAGTCSVCRRCSGSAISGPGPVQSFWNDGWDGYPAARARMIASMRKHALANPVLLGGDVHQNWVGHVKADYANPASPSIGVEFCGTSISARSDDGGKIGDQLARNPHFVFANAERRGYGVVDFTPQRLTTTLRVVDDVTKRDTTIETLAKFSVEAGRPRSNGLKSPAPRTPRVMRYSPGMKNASVLPLWTIATPVAAWLLFGGTLFGLGGAYLVLVAAGLIGGVLSAVHHAEVVAHRVGEPFGTLVLAVAVTVIEVALIVSLMLAGGPETTALARDTVFAAVMIILTGMVGLCLLVGGARHREQSFGLHGVSASLATLAAIVVLTLILPNYTTTDPGPAFTPSQLVVHRRHFADPLRHVRLRADHPPSRLLPAGRCRRQRGGPRCRAAAKVAALSGFLLVACLVVVVLLAKALAPSIEAGVAAIGAPNGARRRHHRGRRALSGRARRACARRAPTGCRRASISRWARRLPASGSPFRPSPSCRSRPA